MENQKLTFEQLPEVVSRLDIRLANIERMLKEDTPLPEPDRFLTLPELAEMLGLAKQTVYGLVARREVPHIKKGKRLYFKKTEIDTWLSEGRRKTVDELKAEI